MRRFSDPLQGRSSARAAVRSGYTLIEILVVISIVLILFSMTLVTVRLTREGDRVSGAAAQIQSFLAGARDRAIYERSPRGVRFFLNPDFPRTVSSMAYIDPSATWDEGTVHLRRWDPDLDGRTNGGNPDINQDGVADDPTDVWMLVGEGTAWWELKRRGLLFDGMRVRIPAGPGGSWYPVNTQLLDLTNPPPNYQVLVLGIPYRDPGTTEDSNSQAFRGVGFTDYELELAPKILPVEPSVLPDGVVIDLDGSRIPNAWRPSYYDSNGNAQGGTGNGMYSQFVDLVYSPRGTLTGAASTGGVIHLYVCDREDSTLLKSEFLASIDPNPVAGLNQINFLLQQGNVFIPPDSISSSVAWASELTADGTSYEVKDRRVVTISAQTGNASIHNVLATDSDGNGRADDPYYFAETGEAAK